MKKLTIREIHVIAERMADDIVAAKQKEHIAAQKKCDAGNKDKALWLQKQIRAMTPAMRNLVNPPTKLKDILLPMRPEELQATSCGVWAYQLAKEITDEITIKQIDCADVGALQKVVMKTFMAK